MGLATWDAAETTRALRLVRGGCGCLFFLSGGKKDAAALSCVRAASRAGFVIAAAREKS